MSRPAVGAALALTLLLAFACSDGDDEPVVATTTTTTTKAVDRVAEFCASVDQLDDTDPFAAVEAATTPAAAAAAFDDGLEAIGPLADDPPDEIADAAHAYVDGFEEFGALLRTAEYNASRVDRDALAAITQAVGTAAAAIEAYAIREC